MMDRQNEEGCFVIISSDGERERHATAADNSEWVNQCLALSEEQMPTLNRRVAPELAELAAV